MSEEKKVPHKVHARLEEVLNAATMHAFSLPKEQQEKQLAGILRARELCQFVGDKGWDWDHFVLAAMNVHLDQAFRMATTHDMQKALFMHSELGKTLTMFISNEQKRKPWLLEVQEQSRIITAR